MRGESRSRVKVANDVIAVFQDQPIPSRLKPNAQDQLPGRLQCFHASEGQNAGPVNCIHSFGEGSLLESTSDVLPKLFLLPTPSGATAFPA
jgi:hypothetical protein